MQKMDNLKDFMDHYGPSLAERIDRELKVIHDPLRDQHDDMDIIMARLKKKPFAVQSEVIKGAVKSFRAGNKAIYITA